MRRGRVFGTVRDAVDSKKVTQIYERFYIKGNITLCITRKFQFEDVMEILDSIP